MNITALDKGLANKKELKKAIKGYQSVSTIHGICDDDGDSNCGDIEHIDILFYLKRYSKENYVLDPINVFFYLLNNRKDKENILKLLSTDLRIDYLDLNEILCSIYSNNKNKQKKAIEILQRIIQNFSRYLKDQYHDDSNKTTDFVANNTTLIDDSRETSSAANAKKVFSMFSEFQKSLERDLKNIEKISKSPEELKSSQIQLVVEL